MDNFFEMGGVQVYTILLTTVTVVAKHFSCNLSNFGKTLLSSSVTNGLRHLRVFVTNLN